MSHSSFQDDVLGELGDDRMTEIAGLLGTDPSGAREAVTQTLGVMADDLTQKLDADDADGAEVRQAFAEVSEAEPAPQGVAAFGGLGGLLSGGMMAGVLAKLSKPVAAAVSKRTGIPAATVSRVIEMLIPVVLAVLAKRASGQAAGTGAGGTTGGAGTGAGGAARGGPGEILGGGKK
ncbi:hypothetical protein DEJ51_11455 [Streptomyces venezuelae]|uniref:DUF937 domain-containing protein n=1 Tax=Streptomyces venezuelae TaxID=54571 RepID=A0A5P2DHY3_STRVZ|nr:DUF937 domain-containing protein [Streptomyces venezuelae]QES54765.1 hypothetical protein DEJ51_11455 [Streptomyces venezuelae]